MNENFKTLGGEFEVKIYKDKTDFENGIIMDSFKVHNKMTNASLAVISGLVGTGGLTIPMFIVLRRFTLLFTLLLERFYLRKIHDWPTVLSVCIMISGAIIAAVTDLSFNALAYAAVLFNDVMTALYLSMVKNVSASNNLSTTGILFYNSIMYHNLYIFINYYTISIKFFKLKNIFFIVSPKIFSIYMGSE